MASLETPFPPSTQPAAVPPLSPAASAFLAAYVACGSDILAAAGKLQISLETALDYLADPALKARLAALDDSERRNARHTATAAINRAISTLSRFTEAQWLSPNTLNAAVHLYRASIWLVRIAENKVPPDRLPARFSGTHSLPGRENIPPNGAPPVLTARADHSPKVGATPSSFSTPVLKQPAPVACMQPDREGGRCATLHPQPSPTNIDAHSPPPAASASNSPFLSPAPTGPKQGATGEATRRLAQPVEVSPAQAGAAESPQRPECRPSPIPGRESTPRDPRLTSLLSRAGAADSS